MNEPIDQSGYMDLPPDQRPKWRSIAVGNLQKIGTLTADLKRARRSKPRRSKAKRSTLGRRRARRARGKLHRRLTKRRRTMSLPRPEYHDSHVNSALLSKLHAIRAKSDAFYKSRNTTKPAFMNYGISKPAAAKFAELAGVKKPRPGYQVDIANESGITWVLINQSGSFSVNARYS